MPATDPARFLDDHSNRERGMRNNDELAKVAKRKARHVNFISPYTCRGRSYPHSDRSRQEQITVMQPYKGYFITGSAMPVHPFSPDWYVGGSVYVSGRSTSIVEITRFQIQRFTVGIKELRNGSGWRLPGSWWMNVWLHERVGRPNTSNAPVPSII